MRNQVKSAHRWKAGEREKGLVVSPAVAAYATGEEGGDKRATAAARHRRRAAASEKARATSGQALAEATVVIDVRKVRKNTLIPPLKPGMSVDCDETSPHKTYNNDKTPAKNAPMQSPLHRRHGDGRNLFGDASYRVKMHVLCMLSSAHYF